MGTLWLIGMMGAGKTTVGRAVARRAAMPFVDLDDEIAAAAGATIPEIFAGSGEAAFRDLEAAAVAGVAGRQAVVAAGGGAVLEERSRRVMRASGTVVWLQAPASELAVRVGRGPGRPLLAGEDPAGRLDVLLRAREADYRAAAHHRVDTTGRDAEQIAEEVAGLWTRS